MFDEKKEQKKKKNARKFYHAKLKNKLNDCISI